MNSKIGIITLYYENYNYGGMLQAYALAYFINRQGYFSEHIKFQVSGKQKNKKENKRVFRFKKIPIYIKNRMVMFNKQCLILYGKIFFREHIKSIKTRNNILRLFGESIPNSLILYTSENITESLNKYDAFVTGSDQVWNMMWYNKEYFLDFVPSYTYKFSYAASMPDVNLSKTQRNVVKKHLASFDAVSVREEKTKIYLDKLLNHSVEYVLDPTLLIGVEDWNKLCSEQIIKDKYVFCYFLGDNKFMRREAKKFAKKMGLKIVTFPHLTKLNKDDFLFGEVQVFEATPGDFISLIKYAEYVITDSFHACVFSNIYNVKYFVFSRIGVGSMDERIISLLDMFNSKERFCKVQKNYMYNLRDLPVNDDFEKFKEAQKKSKDFLLYNLKKSGVKSLDEN